MNSFHDVKSLIFDVCNREGKEVAGRVAVMLEVLWKNRNDYIWNNEHEESSKLGWIAFHKWQEWWVANQSQEGNREHNQVLSWNPPPMGWIKCNVDAGFNNICGTTNRGWCFRDNSGGFVSAGTSWDPGSLSIIEAEALALKEAIQNANDLQCEQVIFESDSLRVVQALRSNAFGNSEFSIIISNIKLLLQNCPNFEVKFIKRQANMVAHSLAKAANSWTRRSFMYNVPPCIERLIYNESC